MKKILSGILAILGLGCTDKPKNDDQTMFMWEDNYLMIELLARENLEYAINETKRINEFGQAHFDGQGFSAITEIKEKSRKTIDLGIKTNEIEEVLGKSGLEKYPKLLYYGGVEPKEIKDPKSLVYGKFKSAIFIEEDNGIVEHIWFDSYNWKDIHRTNILKALNEIGMKYDMIMVDWNGGKIIDLKKHQEIEDYLRKD